MILVPSSQKGAGGLVSLRRLEHLLARDRRRIIEIAGSAGRYYRPFDRRRERGKGKWRHIDNPVGPLKAIQKEIQRKILRPLELPETMLGGVAGRSIRDYAAHHVQQPVLVTLDLQDCFPRIGDLKVYKVFREVLGCSTEIAGLLTKLTTFQHRLPQGAPTSPTLANLTLLRMHREIVELADGLGLICAFYLDDIALSGHRAGDAVNSVIKIIQKHGHSARRRKIRRMRSGEAQKVTSVVVNRKISAGRERRQMIRERIFELAGRVNLAMLCGSRRAPRRAQRFLRQ